MLMFKGYARVAFRGNVSNVLCVRYQICILFVVFVKIGLMILTG